MATPIFSDLDLTFHALQNACLDSETPIPSAPRKGYLRLDQNGKPAFFDGTRLRPIVSTEEVVDLSTNQIISGFKAFTKGVAIASSSAAITDPGAGNLSVNGGILLLNNSTSNSLNFTNVGVSSPTFTTRSTGTKIVLFPILSSTLADFAIGIESGALWQSVSSPTNVFKWYGGTTQLATLSAATFTLGSSTSPANSGILSLAGTANNRVEFNSSGVAAPSFTSRSVGTKIVLFPNVNTASVDYALGIEASTLWSSIPTATTTNQFKWFGGTTELMRLRGDGFLGLGTGTPGAKLHVVGGVAIASTAAAATDPGAGNLRVVGITTTSGLSVAFKTVTASYAIAKTDCTVNGDATGGNITLTLPLANSVLAGQQFKSAKVDSSANTVTLAAATGDTISGSPSRILSTQWQSVIYESNGVNGYILY